MSTNAAKWWPDLYLKKGRKLQAITPEQCGVVRELYNDGRGSSEIRSEMKIYDQAGKEIGHVSYNGRVWVRGASGEDLEVPVAGVKTCKQREAEGWKTSPRKPGTVEARALAYEFARLLRKEIGDEIEDVIARNQEEKSAGVCHSHDFTDANDLMAEAFKKLLGRAIDPHSDRDCVMWDLAWALAKADEFAIDCVTDEERSNGPKT